MPEDKVVEKGRVSTDQYWTQKEESNRQIEQEKQCEEY